MSRRAKDAPPDWVEFIRRQTGREDVDDDGVVMRRGMEVPDPRPLSIPSGFVRPPTLAEQVRRLLPDMIRQQQAGEVETWEDANDFDIGDDFDPKSPWETIYDEQLGREVTPEEFHKNWPQIREEMQVKLRNYYRLQEEMDYLEGKAARGSQGDPPAPSSSAAKPPPAKQSSGSGDPSGQ